MILSAVHDRPVVKVSELCEITGASEATIRRDIAALHSEQKLTRVHGGVEAINPAGRGGLAGQTYAVNETRNAAEKRAIARAAVEMCDDGEPIIIEVAAWRDDFE